MLNILKSALFTALSAATILAASDSDQPRSQSEARLRELYVPGKVSAWDGSITATGSILIVQRPDIRGGDYHSSVTPYANNYENGKINYGFWGSVLVDQNTVRNFTPGDRVYLTKLEFKDNAINFQIRSCDESQDSLFASVAVKFPKNYLASLSLEQIQQTIGGVLAIEGPAIEEQPAVEPAAPPATIALGQTTDEVLAILGNPDTIVRLGMKEIYVYKTLKVTFENGRVVDVQ